MWVDGQRVGRCVWPAAGSDAVVMWTARRGTVRGSEPVRHLRSGINPALRAVEFSGFPICVVCDAFRRLTLCMSLTFHRAGV